MAAYMIVGLLLLIAFLCVSHSIPEMAHRRPARFSPRNPQPPQGSKK